MGHGLLAIDPFKKGGILGPADDAGANERVTDSDINDLDASHPERRAQFRNDYLYGGSETGAQDFNSQVQGTLDNYGGALTGIGDKYSGASEQTGYQSGNTLTNLGQGAYGQGQSLLSGAQGALNGANPNAYVDYGSLDAAQTQAGNMQGAAGKLMAMNFDGPSAAEAQLNAGAQQTAAQNLALAQSGRGLGGGAAARRAAMAQNANVMGQMNGQLGGLRAQEEATRQQNQMQATNAAGGLYAGAGNIYQGDLNSVAQARNAAAGNTNSLGLGLTNAGVSALGQGIQGVNAGAQTQLGGYGQAATEALGAYGQAGQLALSGQSLQNAANTTQLSGTEDYEGNKLQRRAQSMGSKATTQQANTQKQSALISAASTAASAAAMSDRREKTDIKPLVEGGKQSDAQKFVSALGSGAATYADQMSGGQTHYASQLDAFRHQLGLRKADQGMSAATVGGAAGASASDASRMAGGGGAATPYGGPSPEQAQDTVRNAPGYTFRYKQPDKYGQGQRVGIMAQDLEKTPAGAAAVLKTPDGKRAVDTGELSTINTAALNGVQNQVDEHDAKIDDVGAKLEEIRRRLDAQDQGFPQPGQPNTDDLDWAYQREASGYR